MSIANSLNTCRLVGHFQHALGLQQTAGVPVETLGQFGQGDDHVRRTLEALGLPQSNPVANLEVVARVRNGDGLRHNERTSYFYCRYNDAATRLGNLQFEFLHRCPAIASNRHFFCYAPDGDILACVLKGALHGGIAQSVGVVPLQRGVVAAGLGVLEVDGSCELAPVAGHVRAHAGHVDRQFALAEQFALIVAAGIERPRALGTLRHNDSRRVRRVAVDIIRVLQRTAVDDHRVGILVYIALLAALHTSLINV